jgi:hypothetical protein
VTFTTGQDSIKKMSYSEIADRQHCAECGSQISMQYRCEPETIYLTVGTFDKVKGELPKVEMHIFTEGGKKIGGYYDIPKDDVPQYAKHRDGFEKKLSAWKETFLGPGLG